MMEQKEKLKKLSIKSLYVLTVFISLPSFLKAQSLDSLVSIGKSIQAKKDCGMKPMRYEMFSSYNLVTLQGQNGKLKNEYFRVGYNNANEPVEIVVVKDNREVIGFHMYGNYLLADLYI